ncbi:MAG: metallophosphoesterase family protein [bacterium]
MKRKRVFTVLSVLLFLCTAQFCFAVKILKGPYLQDVAISKITVCWETDAPSSGTVFYSLAGNKEAQLSSAKTIEKSPHHCLLLEKLSPSTEYDYWVETDGIKSKIYRFRTAKTKGEDFRFVAYGDSRSNEFFHRQIMGGITSEKPDLILNTGDIVNKGEELPGWDMFFRVADDIMHTTPYYVALGNHEGNHENYFHYFSFPNNERWYSFDYAGSHFIALDTNMPSRVDPDQMKWLKKDLAANKDADFIFVFFHHPPYSSSVKRGSDPHLQKLFSGVFEKYGVNIVFNGHDHFYERALIGNVVYVITGGGGASLYEVGRSEWTKYSESVYHYTVINVSGGKLKLEAKTIDGKTIDSFTMTSKKK